MNDEDLQEMREAARYWVRRERPRNELVKTFAIDVLALVDEVFRLRQALRLCRDDSPDAYHHATEALGVRDALNPSGRHD